jgi:hypothetical protein
MKNNTPSYVTKSQLVTDYVTKREFGEFREEMHDFKDDMNNFRDETHRRFDGVEKRLSNVERKLDSLREEIRIEMGAWRDQIRSDFMVAVEFLQDIALGKKGATDKPIWK